MTKSKPSLSIAAESSECHSHGIVLASSKNGAPDLEMTEMRGKSPGHTLGCRKARTWPRDPMYLFSATRRVMPAPVRQLKNWFFSGDKVGVEGVPKVW